MGIVSGFVALQTEWIVITPELMANNQASWIVVIAFVAKFPKDDTWRKWKKFMHALLLAGVENRLDRYFRAGQSMSPCSTLFFRLVSATALSYMILRQPE